MAKQRISPWTLRPDWPQHNVLVLSANSVVWMPSWHLLFNYSILLIIEGDFLCKARGMLEIIANCCFLIREGLYYLMRALKLPIQPRLILFFYIGEIVTKKQLWRGAGCREKFRIARRSCKQKWQKRISHRKSQIPGHTQHRKKASKGFQVTSGPVPVSTYENFNLA